MKAEKQMISYTAAFSLVSILIAFLFSGKLVTAQSFKNVVEKDGYLLKLSSGVVVDTRLKIMWVSFDNGKDISFEEAKEIITDYQFEGYQNWRIPTIQELETLLVHNNPDKKPSSKKRSGKYPIHRFFYLSGCCPWALLDNGTRPASFPFIRAIAGESMWHHKSSSLGNRIIPVRDIRE